jgi:GTP-binding protein
VDIAPIDPGVDPVRDARAIVAELRKYDVALYRKPRWLVLNKIDLIAPEEREGLAGDFRRRLRTKAPIFAISAVTGEGCSELAAEVARHLEEQRRQAVDESGPGQPADDAARGVQRA